MRTDRRAVYEVINNNLQAVIYDDRATLVRIELMHKFETWFDVLCFEARLKGWRD